MLAFESGLQPDPTRQAESDTDATTSPGTAPALVLLTGLGKIQHGYDPNWSCPLTPFENRVKVPVRAGEKLFPGTEHA